MPRSRPLLAKLWVPLSPLRAASPPLPAIANPTPTHHTLAQPPSPLGPRFGMGHIYYRQEKYGMAEYHFRRALSINARSSVLRCYLGMALHKLKRNAEALDMLGQVWGWGGGGEGMG